MKKLIFFISNSMRKIKFRKVLKTKNRFLNLKLGTVYVILK